MWILIFIMTVGNSSVAIDHIAFKNEKACNNAVSTLSRVNTAGMTVKGYAFCVQEK